MLWFLRISWIVHSLDDVFAKILLCSVLSFLWVEWIEWVEWKKKQHKFSYWLDVFKEIFMLFLFQKIRKNSWKFISQNKLPSFARFGRFFFFNQLPMQNHSNSVSSKSLPTFFFSLLFLFLALRCVFGCLPFTKKWRVTFSFNLFPTVKNYLTWNTVALAGNELIVRSFVRSYSLELRTWLKNFSCNEHIYIYWTIQRKSNSKFVLEIKIRM